ncbi:4198_t:CDS:2 [Funneliformis caledonium]|uniref:4198_t:CDS:1 n=1 Tax=Funneliformis caledonium TaxID=1117310 RepID=A0A9N9CZG3_9GLOM|nr:4198_t:CDS:2 [Funneliformis caledonium]
MNFEAFFKHKDNSLGPLYNEWLENIIEDDRCLAKYGSTLLPKLISLKSIDYIEKIYKSLTTQNLSYPNNPWAISNTFYQTDENGNILNQTLIQSPDEKNNLFYSYFTSLLAMYLFLTDSLSSWTPSENKTLFILMAVFSFLIVIYLMNLFIGLLNMAIEKITIELHKKLKL